MTIETIASLKWLWKLVTWLPGLFFKKKFSKEYFKNQVVIDLRPRGQSVALWAGDKKEVQVWMTITNLTYFDIELDRLVVEFHSAGHQATLTKLDREDIKSLSIKDNIYLRANLTSDHVLAIQRDLESGKRSYISIHAELNTKVHSFKIDKTLEGVIPSFYNFALN